jgi:hypothetical protein
VGDGEVEAEGMALVLLEDARSQVVELTIEPGGHCFSEGLIGCVERFAAIGGGICGDAAGHDAAPEFVAAVEVKVGGLPLVVEVDQFRGISGGKAGALALAPGHFEEAEAIDFLEGELDGDGRSIGHGSDLRDCLEISRWDGGLYRSEGSAVPNPTILLQKPFR